MGDDEATGWGAGGRVVVAALVLLMMAAGMLAWYESQAQSQVKMQAATL